MDSANKAPTSARVRIVVADDDPLVLDEIVRLLETRFDVVGNAANGQELLQAAHDLSPSVVVTDIDMPGLNGIQATRYIKENYPRVRIVVLSVLSDPCIVAAVFEAGASAFVWKDSADTELIPAIEDIL